MSKDKKKVLISLGVVLGLVGVITLSYAFLSVGGKQSLANTFTSGCLNITIDSESNAIGLSNVLPVTDVEGLSTEGYSFTVKNTCSTSADFIVNLENLNRQTNTLSSDYLKVSISGDKFDNIVSKLSSNTASTPSVSNAYEAYTIYTGSIAGNTTRTFKIREWLDYDATKEQAASKVITNKINVIAKSDIEVTSRPEVKQNIKLTKMLGNITGNASSAKYCVTENKICTPNKEVTIDNNKTEIELEIKDEKQVVCISLDNGKVMCSDPSVSGYCPEGGTSCKSIMANIDTIDTRTDFSTTVTEETNKKIYQAEDDDGVTYYYAGATKDNYVKFAGKYWRIIRINGDGTIRMIYDGTLPHANGEISIDRVAIQNVAFNTNYLNNAYVGFKYTVGEVHGTETESTILQELNTWYTNNLAGYADKIDTNAGFCGDRTPSTSSTEINNSGGIGRNDTYYGALIRLQTNKAPSLECLSEDFYTASGSSKGNRSLTNPIGLISADEVAMAGGVNGIVNNNYYLYTYANYWTMSPFHYNKDNINLFHVNSNGALANDNAHVSSDDNARPVINLRADLELTGTGTMTDPYQVNNLQEAGKTILANNEVKTETPDFSKTTCSEGCDDTNSGLYKSGDNDGVSYYFRGSVENNYVKFADKYWRIIRINGDGTIRAIYDGTSIHENGTSTSDSIAVASQTFSKDGAYNDNAYVGFKYGTVGSSTYEATHANTNKSNILEQLEKWYKNNLISYADKIDLNAGFCGNRTPFKNPSGTNSGGGTGTTETYYGWTRLITKKVPSLICPTTDFFTINEASKGNKSLEYPVGLITADEVAMAGGMYGGPNTSYYLYNGQAYWTMSPCAVMIANVFYVYLDGILGFNNLGVSDTLGVRPVINLRADVTLKGTGTMDDPYVVA